MDAKKSMTRLGNALICVVWVLFLLTGVAFAYNLEEYFPLGEGDTWEYLLKQNENGTETTASEKNKIKGTEQIGELETKKMISLKSNNQCLAIDAEGLKLYKYWGWMGGEYEVCKPPRVIFPNMEKGETKTYPIESAAYTIEDVIAEGTMETGTLTITLDSVEDVEVPAGKFKDCLKFVSVYEFKKVHRPESGKEIVTSWLAPGVGKVKSEVIFNEYNKETQKEDKFTESLELTKAIINGNTVLTSQEAPSPEAPSPEAPPQVQPQEGLSQ